MILSRPNQLISENPYLSAHQYIESFRMEFILKSKSTYLIIVLCIVTIIACKQNSTTTVVQSSNNSNQEVKKAGEIDHYICFRCDEIKDLQMSVSFDTYGNALEVKYIGQSQSIPLTYMDEEIITPGHPATKTVYKEIDMGKETGIYEFRHSGNWDYAKYIRKKDGETFNFTIDHEQTVTGNGYRETPCF